MVGKTPGRFGWDAPGEEALATKVVELSRKKKNAVKEVGLETDVCLRKETGRHKSLNVLFGGRNGLIGRGWNEADQGECGLLEGAIWHTRAG